MAKTKILYLGDLRTQSIHESGVKLETVAPLENQGKGDCFSPTDLLALSLGSCVLTLMGIFAKRLGIELKGTSATVEKEMSLAPPRRISKLLVLVQSPIQVTEAQREKIEHAALTCPVKESLHPGIELIIRFQWDKLEGSELAIQQ